MKLSHKFVELVPESIDEGVLYVSIRYKTVVHRCACGCGREVVTPLSPVSWKLTFDGDTISLSPSVGNWEFPCRSHYWITNNRVEWSGDWTEEQVAAADVRDREAKKRYYQHPEAEKAPVTAEPKPDLHKRFLTRIKQWWLRL